MINPQVFDYLAKTEPSQDLDEFLNGLLCRSCDPSVGLVCEKHDE